MNQPPQGNMVINRITIRPDSAEDRVLKQQQIQMNQFQIAQMMRAQQMNAFMLQTAWQQQQLAASRPVPTQQIEGPTSPTEPQKSTDRFNTDNAEDAEFSVVEEPPKRILVETKPDTTRYDLLTLLGWKESIRTKSTHDYAVVHLTDETQKKTYTSVYGREANLTKFLFSKYGKMVTVKIPESHKRFAGLLRAIKAGLADQKKVYFTEEIDENQVYLVEEVGHGSSGRKVLVAKERPMSELREHTSIFEGKESIWSNFDPQTYSVTYDANNQVFTFKPV